MLHIVVSFYFHEYFDKIQFLCSSFSGYGHITTLKDITDEDINEIEKQVRKELVRLLKKKADDCQEEIDENLKAAFFGIYAVCPEEFKFMNEKLIKKNWLPTSTIKYNPTTQTFSKLRPSKNQN